MRYYRVSIAGGLVGILVLALAMAAIRAGTQPWSRAVGFVALFAKTAATAGAFVGRGRRRAFSIGFALFGWQFLTPIPGVPCAAEASSMVDQARSWAVALHPYAVSPARPRAAAGENTFFEETSGKFLRDVGGRARYSEDAILGLATLVYATLGGLVAMALASPRRGRNRGRGGGRP